MMNQQDLFMNPNYEKCVHTEHCTIRGCKYADDDCPVVLKIKPASYPDNDIDQYYDDLEYQNTDWYINDSCY